MNKEVKLAWITEEIKKVMENRKNSYFIFLDGSLGRGE